MNYFIKKLATQLAIILGLLIAPLFGFSCTIVSAIAHNGHVWTANNEDGPFGVANFINVFPKSGKVKFGYYTLSYFSPAQGEGGGIQGGMNEAGLTFDFNAIPRVKGFDPSAKPAFPEGDNAILPHILGNMSTVQEVIAFFNEYWFQKGFHSAQLHVSDRNGRFAIISGSGVELVEKGQHLVSTNFDICGKEDGSSCWRFPLATRILNQYGASLATMKKICQETAQKNGATMYSNIQNLTTGDMWLFSKHDPDVVVSTNIQELLKKGRKSYSFSNLNEIKKEGLTKEWNEPNTISLDQKEIDQFAGEYENSFIGKITVKSIESGIQISFADGTNIPLFPASKNVFYLPKAKVSIEFGIDEKNRKTMSMHENRHWSFTAWQSGQ